MTRKIILIFTVLVVFLCFSCNDSNVGVFYGLSQEEKVSDYSLPNHITSENIVKINNILYLAGGSIYKKPSEGKKSDWTRINSPDGYKYATEMAALSDGTIFILAYDSDEAKPVLFKGDGSGDFTGEWEKVEMAANGDLSKIKIANDIIYISDKQGRLYYSTDKGASFSQDTALPKLHSSSTGYFDLVTDGTTCYLNAQYKIYRGNYNSWTEFIPKDSGGSRFKDKDERFTRLYYYSDTVTSVNRLYAADTEGYVYAVDSPSSAGETEWARSDDNTSGGLGLQGMIQIKAGSSSVLLCGSGITGGRGYYEVWNPKIEHPGNDNNGRLDPERPNKHNEYLSDYYDYLAFDLSEAAITNFFVDLYSDGENYDIYAMTYSCGIWKNSYNGGERRWNRE